MHGPNFLQLTEDDSVKWHAFRGIDLAALETTLGSGLPRSFQDHHHGWNLSLSGSPEGSFRSSREILSFLTYTMNPSCLAVAVRTHDARHEPHGGFQDEYHSTSPIEPSRIVGVTGHDETLESRLSDIDPSFEPMRVHRCLDYLQRNVAWTAMVCGQAAADELAQHLEPYRQKTGAGLGLDRAETTAMQKTILGTYALHLGGAIGRAPTVSDAVSDVIQRSGSQIPLLSWDMQAKHSLQARNVQIAVANSSAGRAAAFTFTQPFGKGGRIYNEPYGSHGAYSQNPDPGQPPHRR